MPVTTSDRAVSLIEDRLELGGLDQRCASVRASGLGDLDLEGGENAATTTAIIFPKRGVLSWKTAPE